MQIPKFSNKQVLALIALLSWLGLAFALYLQWVVKLEPCPMCIVQRYALIAVAIFSTIALLLKAMGTKIFSFFVAIFASFGAFVAAKQSWLQWNPPEVVSCGRDFYGMIESLPLSRAIPMIFRGSGDCSKIDWTFLGGSIANWSFVFFVVAALLTVKVLLTKTSLKR